MSVTRAINAVFEDRDWAGKLAIVAILTLFVPFLLPLILLLGYGAALARNVRAGMQFPLPRWDNYNAYASDGLNLLVACVVYTIPNLILSGCIFTLSGVFGRGLMGSALNLVLLCCLTPILIGYNLITWPMLAVGAARYLESGQPGEFYRFGELLAALRDQTALIFQWMVLTLLVNLTLVVLAVIPCVGWVAVLALAFPVHGHLLGQFAREIGAKPKRKR